MNSIISPYPYRERQPSYLRFFDSSPLSWVRLSSTVKNATNRDSRPNLELDDLPAPALLVFAAASYIPT